MRTGDVIGLRVKIDAAAVLSACFSPWLTRGPAADFFFPSHPVTPLSPSSSCSTSPHFLLSLSLYSQPVSTLIQRLISLPLSPDQVTGEEFFFFCFLPGTHMVPGLPGVTARLEEKIVAMLLPLRPRNLLRVGGREQTLACVSVWERKVTSLFPKTLFLAYL